MTNRTGQIIKALNARKPVFISKVSASTRDFCIPFIAHTMGIKIAKVGFNNLSSPVDPTVARNIILDVLATPIKKETMLWVKEINLIREDISSFILYILPLVVKNPLWIPIFSGIGTDIGSEDVLVVSMNKLNEEANNADKPVQKTNYRRTGTDTRHIKAPCAIHFRTYGAIYASVTNYLSTLPDCQCCTSRDIKDISIGIGSEYSAPINSIISVVTLGIKNQADICIRSGLCMKHHIGLVDAIYAAWIKEPAVIDVSQVG